MAFTPRSAGRIRWPGDWLRNAAVTPRLWRALNRPPATHPLFQRTVVLPAYSSAHYLSWANLIISLILGLSRYAPTLLFLLMPFILLILGLTYGLDCALRVGSAIARERENDTYGLLSLSPNGPLGAMWALATSAIYRNHDFMRLRGIVRASLLTGLAAGIVVTGIALFVNADIFNRFPQPPTPIYAGLLNFAAIVGALYVEYVQSVALGVLVGLLVSTYARSRLDASMWVFGVYLLLQMMIYVLTMVVGFTALPLAAEALAVRGDFALAGLSFARLGIFVLMREVVIALAWRGLQTRLNITPAESTFINR
ncbi:MAG: hypothetical protein HXY41_13195 [Chloroflexi bacterium]|nr:hypothetical protein [Chloroflexota bacterium]